MANHKKGKNLAPSDRLRIAQRLLSNNKDGVLKYGITGEVATSFGVSVRTIRCIWQAAKKQVSADVPISFPEVRPRQPSSSIQKLDEEAMKAIPFEKRGTIRRLAKELEISKSQIGRWVKAGKIKAHTNSIKPSLTDANKLQRLKYSLCFLHQDTNTQKCKYESMHNIVHIDEKWFYMQRATERAYKLAAEEDPYRACKSKRFIQKVMFMCAVARPQYSDSGEVIFDGKIGIFPFTKQEPAIRNSANRARGTLVTKPIDSINSGVIKSCILDQVLPAIKAKWPPHASKTIIIQQDNARPHLSNFDPDFRRAATADGFDIKLMCQPPNSPDTNVLDLGFFRAIQSLQIETRSYNVDDLVSNVLKSFEDLESIKLDYIYLSLQGCLVEIMKAKGGNNYKLPHMGKTALALKETLPQALEVEEQITRQAIEHLIEQEQTTVAYDIEGIMADLGYM